MYRLIGIFGFGLIAILIWLKIKNSKWFDNLFKEATIEKNFDRPETTQVINNIATAEEALADRAGENEEQVEVLKRDNQNIHEFLKSRNSLLKDTDKEDTFME